MTGADLAAVSITTHRETGMIWDRKTGEPVHNAVVWISKQTDEIVKRWSAEGLDEVFLDRTGVFNDSYFSAAKIVWLMENVPDVRRRAEAGELAFGTPDTWLLWNLTGGRSHLTDHSCASRTALFNLESMTWDAQLCETLGIPMAILPDAIASDGDFGLTAVGRGRRGGPDPRRSRRSAGRPVRPGLLPARFGEEHLRHRRRAGRQLRREGPARAGLTSSVGWTVLGVTDYELEGVVFHSGQTLSWMKDNLAALRVQRRDRVPRPACPGRRRGLRRAGVRRHVCTALGP